MKPGNGSYRTVASSGEALDLTITSSGATSAIGTWFWDGDTLVHSKLSLIAEFDASGPGTMKYVLGNPPQTVVATYAPK